jgi:hypothetical protein
MGPGDRKRSVWPNVEVRRMIRIHMFREIDDEAFSPFIRIPLKGQAIPLKGYLSF